MSTYNPYQSDSLIIAESSNPKLHKTLKSQNKLLEFSTTTVFCRYSGLPILVDSYMGQKFVCTHHWIFDKNKGEIFKFLLTAKTPEQRKLTQLAFLKSFNLLKLKQPIFIKNSVLESYHSKVVEICTLLLFKVPPTQSLEHILPKLQINKTQAANSNDYSNFLDTLEEVLITFFGLQSLDSARSFLEKEYLSLPQFDIILKKELQEFNQNSPYRYSKKIGRQLLDVLSEVPENNYIRNNYSTLKTYLLNEGFLSAENLATVYCAIIEAQLEGSGYIEHRTIVLNWVANQIDIILELEAGFFGKKQFIRSTGKIINSSSFQIVNDAQELFNILQESDASTAEPQTNEEQFIFVNLKSKSKLIDRQGNKIVLTLTPKY